MMFIIIKYFAMFICSLYIFLKLLKITPIKKSILKSIIYYLILSLFAYFLRIHALLVSIFIIVIIFAFLVSATHKAPMKLSLTTSVISFGISYVIFLISMPIVGIIAYVFNLITNEYFSVIFTLICTVSIQFTLIFFLFKIKRLKSGMPFLMEYGSSDVGVYISLLILLAVSALNTSKDEHLIYIIPIFITIINGITLFFWWRNSLTQSYIKKVKDKELNELQTLIHEKELELKQVKHENEKLSSIIHKDNKLIPSMEYAVREYLLSAEQEINQDTRINKANELLKQLSDVTKERFGILKEYELGSKKLPLTNVLSVDTLLTYMLQKATKFQIDYDLSISGNVDYLVDNIISESDIRTLLADIIDNAIIATKNCTTKRILINFVVLPACSHIDIFDSGEQFKIETLKNIGLKRTTTHLNEGGSGIGLMTLFNIKEKYHASFVIEELHKQNIFTKKLSIYFDELSQFRIITKRTNKILFLAGRKDVIIERN